MGPQMDCKYDTGKGASYDLTKLADMSRERPLVITDSVQDSQADYQYTFGICNAVASPANCLNPDGSWRVHNYWMPAWQTNRTENDITKPDVRDRLCMYLGGDGEGNLEDDSVWSLLPNPADPTNPDPSAGIRLTYKNGQKCSHGQKRREMHLNFKCARAVETVEKTVMDESSHCEYEITIESEYACPLECGFGGHALCNDHGVCGYDSDLGAARCFCNEGFSGSGCENNGSAPNNSANYGPILGL